MLQYEALFQIQKEEVELRAREAWKFEKALPVRKSHRSLLERFQMKKQPVDCGCTCAPC